MSFEVAILIPCFNEELTIKKVVGSFNEALKDKDFSYKIFVYDNNSTDSTLSILKSISLNNFEYKVEPLQGKGNVVRKMFHDIDADCYILVDGDDTYCANDCIKMIESVKNKNIDMVIGDRLSTSYFSENKRLFHSFGNKLVSKLINKLFKSKIIDIMSGYRAFSKRFVKTSGILSKGFELETEMTILALDGFYNIEEMPINYKDRIEGSVSKLNTYLDGFKVLKTIFVLFKDYRAFEFFFVIFCIFLFIAAILFLPVFVEYIKTGLVPRFPTLFVSIFFALLSILSFSIGVILSSITKLHKRNREVTVLNYKK